MTNKRFITSLDIGSSKVCVFIFENLEEGLSFLGAGCAKNEGVMNGKVVDVEKTSQSILNALEKAEKATGKTVLDVWVGVSGKHIRSLNASGTFNLTAGDSDKKTGITQEAIDLAIESAQSIQLPSDQIILHTIPQSFSIDNGEPLINPLEIPGKKLTANVHLVTADKNELTGMFAALDKNTLTYNKLILEPLASSYAVLTQEEKKSGVALVDIGSGTTDISVYLNDALILTAVFPFGGQSITGDIAQLLHITEEDAEDLKKKFGTCFPQDALADKIFDVHPVGERPHRNTTEAELAMYIEARMVEILALIHKQLKSAGLLSKLTAGIVFTGGGSHLRGLTSLTEKLFDLPVRIGNPIYINNLPEKFKQPEYAMCIGLAQYGIEEIHSMENDIDFPIDGWFNRLIDFYKKHF